MSLWCTLKSFLCIFLHQSKVGKLPSEISNDLSAQLISKSIANIRKKYSLMYKSSHKEIVHYYTLEFHPYKWYSPIQKKYALNGLRQ